MTSDSSRIHSGRVDRSTPAKKNFVPSAFRRRAMGLVVIVTIVGVTAVMPASAQVIYQYTLTESGDIPASRRFTAVNDSGQVVGTSYIIAGPAPPPIYYNFYPVPSRSSPGIPPPPTPPSASSPSSGFATDINNRGQVAAALTNNDFGSAVRYTDGVGWQNLGAGPGGAANGINNSGQVVGMNSLGHAFRFTDGIGIKDLGVPTGFTRSAGITINNSGQVAINATNSQGLTRAFRYTDGVGFEDLGTPAGVASAVAGINSRGQLAINAGGHGYRYADGIGLEDLGQGYVTGISAIGVLTGNGPSEYRDGFGWRNLNPLISPDPQQPPHVVPPGLPSGIFSAVDISEGGTILGLGFHPIGITDVFVLTPIGVPEPSALLLLGFVAAGGLAVRLCRRLTLRRAFPLVLLALLTGPTAARAQVIYDYTAIGGPGQAAPWALSNSGQALSIAIGSSSDYSGVVTVAARYTPGTGWQALPAVPLLPPPPPSSAPGWDVGSGDLNSSGVVVATATGSPFGSAVRYIDGIGWQNLGAGPGGAAHGINESGQVVGVNNRGHAFRFTDWLGPKDLGLPTGFTTSVGMAINNAGQVAVNATNSQLFTRAFRYTDGVGYLDLGTPAGVSSVVAGIDDRGRVAVNAGGRIYRYTDGIGLEDLGPGYVSAVSALGVLVGSAGTYQDGVGWRAISIREQGGGHLGPPTFFDINDSGTILGTALYAPPPIPPSFPPIPQPLPYQLHFLLTPVSVPEPSALALLGLAAASGLALQIRRRITVHRALSFALFAILTAPAGVRAQPVLYTVTDLGVLPGAADSLATGINDAGQVVGNSGNFAFRYTPAAGMVALGTLAGATESSAAGINSSGQIAGTSGGRAFRYTPGAGMAEVGAPPGALSVSGAGINDAGQVVGTAQLTGPGGQTQFRGFRYADGQGLVDLGPGPAGMGTLALAINNAGQVAGSYYAPLPPPPTGARGLRPFRYADGAGLVALPTGGLQAQAWYATAINAAGTVAGVLTSPEPFGTTFLYSDGIGTQFPSVPPGFAGSGADGINDAGQVVGALVQSGGSIRAMFYSASTGMVDLNTRTGPTGGWVLQEALDINNVGEIVGYGTHDGLTRAFLLSPVPVPEPSAVALLGLAAAVGGLLRRWSGGAANRRDNHVGNGRPLKSRRLALSRLEDRLAPAVVSYTSSSGALTFTADPGDADVVGVSAPAANQVQIRVGNGDMISLAGDAVADANFVLSSFATANDTLTIATGPGHAPATAFVVNLGDQGDRLDFGLAATPNGVGSVAIDSGPHDINDTVTLNAAVSVAADLTVRTGKMNLNAPINSGGSVTLTSIDTLNVSSSVTAWGDLTLTTDFGIDLAASLSALGNITLRSDAGGNIRQLAGSITANGVAASFGRYGNLTLDQPGNDVNVFAASVVDGTLCYADADDLTVGAVGQTSGITVSDYGMIATLITGGRITLTKDVNCENVVFRTAAGGVVQTGGIVKGKKLVLLGSGQFVLTQADNDVAGIAANVTGPVTYTDANALEVATFVPSIPYDVNQVRGITTAGGAVNLTASGNLSIGGYLDNAAISVGPGGAVSLRAGGSVTGGINSYPNRLPGIVAANLTVSAGTGIQPFLVTQIARLEAQTAAGGLVIMNTGDLIVGGVDPNFSGIRVGSGAGFAQLWSTGTLSLQEGVSTAGGTVEFSAGGTVTQTPGGTITATAFGVQTSGGDVVLDESNHVGLLAALNSAVGGTIVFTCAESLTVGVIHPTGSFATMGGILTKNGDVTIRTGGGFTARHGNFYDEMFNLGTGRFLLIPGTRPPETLSTPSVAHTIIFDAEIVSVSVRIGSPAGELLSNVFRDTFSIRPSANVAIDIEGNNPTAFAGDALSLIVAGGSNTPDVEGVVLTPGTDPGSGTFTFANRQPLTFAGIESLAQVGLTAYAIQTGPQTVTNQEPFIIEIQGRFGPGAVGPMSQVTAPAANPFMVSGGPLAPFTAPRLAVADVNGDGFPDLIVAAGSNSPPLITVVDGARLLGLQAGQQLRPEDLLAQFVAYDPLFVGGVYVAAGDFDGDGRAEIVTGAGEGGGPHVRTFQYDAGAAGLGDRMKPFAGAVGNFFAYNPAFRGGVRVAVGDVDGDGTPDIVTGAGTGGGPHVKAFSVPNGAVLLSFFAYDAAFRGGVYVAAGDIDGEGRADIITGAGEGGGPHVKVFSGDGAGLLTSFFAYGADFRGGVRVAVGDLNGDGTPDVITGPGSGGGPHVKAFSETGGPVIASFMVYDDSLRYGIDPAAGS